MKKSIKLLQVFLTILSITLFSCQQEDSSLSGLEGNLILGSISLEFAPMGKEGSRLAGSSTWIHIFPNSVEIVFTNKTTSEQYILVYNPNDFSTPYSILLPFGIYEFYSKVEVGIFSDYLAFEAKGEFVLDSQSLEISLQGKTDYGLVTVKDEFLDKATVSKGNIEAVLILHEEGEYQYKYAKGGTVTTLEIKESILGTTIRKEINIMPNTHYNFVLKRGEGTANITDIVIDPFGLEEEEIIIGSNAKFFDENGTIKCPQASPGDKGEVNGKVYEAVDRALLIQRRDEGASLSCVCTSLVTDMRGMIQAKSGFNENISSWDVSNVTNMERMFDGARNFNQSLEKWNVSNVTNMIGFFGGARSFNQPIGNWNVSMVTNMRGMFSGATNFNQPIGDWDVSNVLDMGNMFYEASNFNQPLASWDVSNVEDMSTMFNSALAFNQPIGIWDVSNVTNMRGMFSYTNNFNQQIENWNVSNVVIMERMFNAALAFNQPIGNWDVGNVTNMTRLFFYGIFDQPIGDWDVSNVVTMEGMFTISEFNQCIENWNVSKVTDIGSMFMEAKNFNQNLTDWCVKNFLTEPDNFSSGSPLSQDNKPIWGTCPE